MSATERLEAANRALAAGQWQEARDGFAALVADHCSAGALFGHASALWWTGELATCLSQLEKAYAAFRQAEDPMFAAVCALRLAFHHHYHLDSAAVASGWASRAARLIEDHALAPLEGELLLIRAQFAPSPHEGELLARRALALGREQQNPDLELCALALSGALLVELGRVDEGVLLLDEAMAACLGGEHQNPDTMVYTSCVTMVSCTRCADFERALQWVRASESIADRLGFGFYYLECRTLYARIRFATGDFVRAEEAARSVIESGGPARAYVAAATALLAELRLAQGRLEEAERLLAGQEAHGAAVPVTAELLLLQDRPKLARSTLERRLDLVGDAQLESAVLLELLGRAEIALDEHDAARARGERLVRLGSELGCRLMVARGHRLVGRALATSDVTAARRALDQALAVFDGLDMGYEAAATRLVIASVLAVDGEVAVHEARAAMAALTKMGARRLADEAAALLRRLGVKAASPASGSGETLTRREREVLALLGEGLSNPEIAKRLFVSRKTVEHHVAHVLAKLGLRSRAEAAAEAVRMGPPPETRSRRTR